MSSESAGPGLNSSTLSAVERREKRQKRQFELEELERQRLERRNLRRERNRERKGELQQETPASILPILPTPLSALESHSRGQRNEKIFQEHGQHQPPMISEEVYILPSPSLPIHTESSDLLHCTRVLCPEKTIGRSSKKKEPLATKKKKKKSTLSKKSEIAEDKEQFNHIPKTASEDVNLLFQFFSDRKQAIQISSDHVGMVGEQDPHLIPSSRFKKKNSRTIAAGLPAKHFFSKSGPIDVRQLLSSQYDDDDNDQDDDKEKKKIKSQRKQTCSSPYINPDELKLTKTRIVANVPYPATAKLTRSELSSTSLLSRFDWIPDVDLIKEHLRREGKIEQETLISLISMATSWLKSLPNCLHLQPPLIILGDIHGQFYDLVNLWEKGKNDLNSEQFLFLGDYVDRGLFSVEVCIFLVALLLNFPNQVHLLRGNHECRLLTTNFNFRRECLVKYSEIVYDAFMQMFDCLPLAAIIESTLTKEKFFCCHGGISPDFTTINELQQLDRICEIPSRGLICDLLWADPVTDQSGMTEAQVNEWKSLEFQPNATRGCSFEFGWKAVEQFLSKNDFRSIIRAHEVKRAGYQEHYFRKDKSLLNHIPPVITVFSAPNYCDIYENFAAFLQIGSDGKIKFHQMSWDDHPYHLPNFDNAFSFSIPLIKTFMAEIFVSVLEYCDVSPEQAKALEVIAAELAKKKEKAISITKLLLSDVQWLGEKRLQRADSGDPFEMALLIDIKNEKRPRPSLFRRSTCVF